MEVDALDYATGEVLSMKCKNGRQKSVAFLSKSLNEIEKNYEIHDKEMLAVVIKLENWRYLLEDTKFKFEVQTDHENLEYFMKVQKLNTRQDYWILYLSRFNFILKHVLGTKIEKKDGLVKDWTGKQAQKMATKVVKVVEDMKKTRVKLLQEDEWQIERDLVLKKRKVYVLKNEEVRMEIIQLHYDVLVGRHEEK